MLIQLYKGDLLWLQFFISLLIHLYPFLYVCTIWKHYSAEICCSLCGYIIAKKTSFKVLV
jgi:hypothetical protein